MAQGKKPKEVPDPLDVFLAEDANPPGISGIIGLQDRDITRGSEEWPYNDARLDKVAVEIGKLYAATAGCAHNSRAVKRYYEKAEKLWSEAAARRKISKEAPLNSERITKLKSLLVAMGTANEAARQLASINSLRVPGRGRHREPRA